MLEGVRRYSGSVFLDGEDGMYLHAYDVADAWAAKLAEIRAAVEAERGEVETLFRAHDVPDTGQVLRPWWTKQYALDALLAVIP